MQVWRSTTSVLVSRQSALYAMKNSVVNKTIERLLTVNDGCPEQLFWATIFGNKNG